MKSPLDDIIPPKNKKYETYFKYISDDPNVIDGLFNKRKIRFTQPAVLNDPLECNPDFIFEDKTDLHTTYQLDGVILPSRYMCNQLIFVEKYYNLIGILSLTKNPVNYDMWNHYANGHKGILIEFKKDFYKYDGFKERGLKEPLQKVDYANPFSIEYDKLPFDGFNGFDLFTQTIGRMKSTHWKKEKEYRLFKKMVTKELTEEERTYKVHRDYDIHLFDYDINAIESITFGVNTHYETKKLIRNAVKGNDIKLHQALLVRDRNLKVGFIKSDDRNINLVPQAFIQDSKQFEDKATSKVITDISEIPFYHSISKYLDTFYENRIKGQKQI